MRLVDLDVEILKLQNEAENKRNCGDHVAADVILYIIDLLEKDYSIAFDYDNVYRKLEHKMWDNSAAHTSYTAGKYYAYEDSLGTVKSGVRNYDL